MKHKHLLANLIEKFFPDGSIGVEIGVDKAETTKYLLENCRNMHKLYAIDPYFGRDRCYEVTKDLLSKYSKCELIRKTSHEAANDIPNSIDFVFIDGDHGYGGVELDLKNYVPKIKSGGLLTGHDWTCVRSKFEVVQACNKFFVENENLFNPLYSNETLQIMGLGDFKRGGWNKEVQRHLIHKKCPSAFPLWWLVKK